MPAAITEHMTSTNPRALQASAPVGRSGTATSTWPHPLVAQACQVAAPSPVRPSGRSGLGLGDPDRMVVLSCLVSFVVMPFLL